MFKPILSSAVTLVNAGRLPPNAASKSIESRSTRARNYTNLISVKLETSGGSRKIEGAVFEQTPPRLVLVDGIAVEAPLDGTMLVMCNTDQPGVIGDVGTDSRPSSASISRPLPSGAKAIAPSAW